jgi:hypothetical protein
MQAYKEKLELINA